MGRLPKVAPRRAVGSDVKRRLVPRRMLSLRSPVRSRPSVGREVGGALLAGCGRACEAQVLLLEDDDPECVVGLAQGREAGLEVQ